MINQYCAHYFARNWQLPFLNQRKGENDRRKYFMINLHERMLPTSAGVEPATSWSPVGQHFKNEKNVAHLVVLNVSSADRKLILTLSPLSFWNGRFLLLLRAISSGSTLFEKVSVLVCRLRGLKHRTWLRHLVEFDKFIWTDNHHDITPLYCIFW